MTGGVMVRCCNTRRVGGDCWAEGKVVSGVRLLDLEDGASIAVVGRVGAVGVVVTDGAGCRNVADGTGRVGETGAVLIRDGGVVVVAAASDLDAPPRVRLFKSDEAGFGLEPERAVSTTLDWLKMGSARGERTGVWVADDFRLVTGTPALVLGTAGCVPTVRDVPAMVSRFMRGTTSRGGWLR
jgi:hypothetical protein